MVKRRHKPISHSDEEISTLNPRKPHQQGGATTPLTLDHVGRQPFGVLSAPRDLALRRAMLAEQN
jgi:hypothetical protein